MRRMTRFRDNGASAPRSIPFPKCLIWNGFAASKGDSHA